MSEIDDSGNEEITRLKYRIVRRQVKCKFPLPGIGNFGRLGYFFKEEEIRKPIKPKPKKHKNLLQKQKKSRPAM